PAATAATPFASAHSVVPNLARGGIDLERPRVATTWRWRPAVVAFIAVGRPMVDVVSGVSHDQSSSLSIPARFGLEKTTGVRQFPFAEVRAAHGGALQAIGREPAFVCPHGEQRVHYPR